MKHQAFTLIELLVVMTIAAIITAMSAIGLQRALRSAAVDQATGEIVRAANEARNLAMREVPSGKPRSYGVIIVDDPTIGAPFVAILHGGPDDGQAGDGGRIWTDASGKAVHRVELRRSAVLWVGSETLRNSPGSAVSWWYRPGSGVPVRLRAACFSLAPIGVGLPAIVLDRAWGQSGPAYSGTVDMVASGSSTEPGLSVRTPDGRSRQAIAVFPSGALVRRGF